MKGMNGLARKSKSETAEVKEEVVQTKEPLKANKKQIKIDPNDRFVATNGFPGRLFFGSKKTGMSHVWEKLGDVDELTYDEIIEIRNQHSGFFSNHYLHFDDSDMMRAALIDKYYVNSLNVEELQALFDLPNAVIAEKVNLMTKAQKQTVAYLAIQKIEDGSLDSRSKIDLLEKLLADKLVISE